MTFTKIQIGSYGESIARDSLSEKGFIICENNYRSQFGEVDIIARKDNTYAFVEVKCRIGDKKGMPYEAVNKSKIFKIMQTAKLYVLKKNLKNYKLSVHVVSIMLNSDMTVCKMKHYEDVSL